MLAILVLAPLGVTAFDAATGGLAAEPVKDVLHRTGFWGLVLLVATLAVTPLRRLAGWHLLQRHRRLFGLCAFGYLTLHFLVYVALDQTFDWPAIAEDIGKRPFITVGFAGLLLLLPLAVTSSAGWVRRLGRRWGRLHALVYVAALAGIVHFTWSQKRDIRRPTVFAIVVAGLLATRLRPRRAEGGPPAGDEAGGRT